jgi:hypothetical protein
MYQPNRRFGVVFWAAAALSCAAAQKPDQQLPPLNRVNNTIWAAERAGAAQYPPAARLLERSRMELMQAAQAKDTLDQEYASLLLERSRMDAVLALQLLRTREDRRETHAQALSLSSQSPPAQLP